MSLAALFLFAGIFAAAAASPGPAVTSLVARVLSKGLNGAFGFIIGVTLGDLLWFAAAVSGMAVLAATFQPVFEVIKWLGVAYLVWLAVKMWRAPVDRIESAHKLPERSDFLPMTLAGLSLTLGNPKTMVFYLAILPSVVDLAALTPAGIIELSAVIVVVLQIILGTYALAASRARRIFRTPRAVRLLNRSCAGIMTGAAAAIAARS
ncbi:MAG: LysE family translocator [Hyphomicrobiaceae bacterium]|nr:LysE family translocator [Hyphomicrobiaceae bacterium]